MDPFEQAWVVPYTWPQPGGGRVRISVCRYYWTKASTTGNERWYEVFIGAIPVGATSVLAEAGDLLTSSAARLYAHPSFLDALRSHIVSLTPGGELLLPIPGLVSVVAPYLQTLCLHGLQVVEAPKIGLPVLDMKSLYDRLTTSSLTTAGRAAIQQLRDAHLAANGILSGGDLHEVPRRCMPINALSQ